MNDRMREQYLNERISRVMIGLDYFDAMRMEVIRKLHVAYDEYKNKKGPMDSCDLALRDARMNFYKDLILQCIETDFRKGELLALYCNDELASDAWSIVNDVGCSFRHILVNIAKLSLGEPNPITDDDDDI